MKTEEPRTLSPGRVPVTDSERIQIALQVLALEPGPELKALREKAIAVLHTAL
jgi:hypothetical protein